jgi:hypothetical protein
MPPVGVTCAAHSVSIGEPKTAWVLLPCPEGLQQLPNLVTAHREYSVNWRLELDLPVFPALPPADLLDACTA